MLLWLSRSRCPNCTLQTRDQIYTYSTCISKPCRHTLTLGHCQNALPAECQEIERGLKTAGKALGWAWREQLARFTALSSNHRQMNGHRPCFIWAGLMPGLWTHWQGQINHTSFSLGLENIEERKNERAKKGWKTLPPAGWASVLFSASGMIWYYSRQKKHTKTMLRKKKIKRQTHYIERNQLWAQVICVWSLKKIPHTQNWQKVLWQFTYNGIRCWYMVPFYGICLVFQGTLNTNILVYVILGRPTLKWISNSFS